MSDMILAAVADLLRRAKHALFVTGAGLSADSGLPTYRGVGGLYERATTEEGMPIEEALSGGSMRTRPEIAWKYLWQIGAACRAATFNRGHAVIAAVEQREPDTWVLTQNVDGFHRAAGSRNVIEIHGRASDIHCMDCAFASTADDELDGYGDGFTLPPHCPECGGVVRPDVVLFGEMLPSAAIEQLLDLPPRDLVIAVGTSAAFPYIVEPVVVARAAGIPTVEINPGTTDLSALVDHHLALGAAAALGALWALIDPAADRHHS